MSPRILGMSLKDAKHGTGDLTKADQDEVDEVEAGEEGGGQVDVVDDGEARIVARADGVGGGEDAGARVERRDDARLGHAHRLLLHHLVQLRPGF